MDDFRNDEIIYDEDWLGFDSPVYAEHVRKGDEPDAIIPEPEHKQKRQRRFPALITIQLILCLVIAFSVFMLKAMNSDTYKEFRDWYAGMMQQTLIPNSSFEDIDLSSYLKSTADEI